MFREWAPLEHVLSRVPPIGRLGQEQDVTCLAASPDYLALGTSCGSVYWYDRKGDTLQRLDCWTSTRVSCLQLVETVDIMLAVGSYEGEVAIFQIPKPVQPGIGAAFPGTAQNIQHFSIRGVHARSITALSWSLNGQRLFSGDKSGTVACSSIDFFQNSATSRLIVRGSQEILWLDYKQKSLLVSTLATSYLLNLEDSNKDVKCKIGDKERKFGKFGGALMQMGVGKSGMKAIVVRPNNRLWMADLQGKVERTVILKEALVRSHSQIPIINPANIANEGEENFHHVCILSETDKLVLIWNNSALHVVCLEKGLVLASCNTLRNIIDLTVTPMGEIFVLETGRTLIRLARTEDSLSVGRDWRRGSTVSQGADSALESTVESFSSNIAKKMSSIPVLNSFAAGLKAGSWRDKLGLNTKTELYAQPSSPAEEVVEALDETDLTPRSTKDEDELTRSISQNNLLDVDFKSRMDKIGEQEYQPTLRSPKRQKKRSRRNSPVSQSPGNSTYSDSSDTLSPREDVADVKLNSGMLPQPSTVVEDIKQKEDRDLNLQENKEEGPTDINYILSNIENTINDAQTKDDTTAENDVIMKDELQNEEKLMKLLNLEEHISNENCQEKEACLPCDENGYLQPTSLAETKDSSLLSEARYSLPYGPPSDSSALTVSIVSNDQKSEESKEADQTQENNSITFEPKEQEMISPGISIGDSWQKYELPSQSGSLCENKEYLCFCDNRENVFYSECVGTSLSWKRADFNAICVSSSSCGYIVWRLYRHTAYCLLQADPKAPFGEKWVKICDNVASLWVGEGTGWLVKLDGGLVCHQNLTPGSPYSTHPRQIYTGLFLTSVREHAGHLIALTGQNSGLVQCPLDNLTTESAWSSIFCVLPAVSVFNIGVCGELWVADGHSNIHFSTDWHSYDNNQQQPTWAKLSLQLSDGAQSSGIPGGVLSPALCKPILCPGKCQLWVASPLSSHLHSNPYLITGYRWSKLSFSSQTDKFRLKSVYGGSRDAYSGFILLTQYCQHLSNNILWTNIHDGKLNQLALPPGAVLQDISAVPGFMWLLTVKGSIYIRAGLSTNQPVGTSWVKLSLGQLAGHRLLSISLGTDQAWAVDDEGGVYMRLGSLLPPPAHASPAWLPVDQALDGQSRISEGAQLVQVVCSNQGDMVWARDSNHGVYVREAVYPELPVGTGWFPVTGLSVVSLAISRSTVWALSTSGQVFRRRGVSSTDWAGEAWQAIPAPEGQGVSLSVGQSDTVWALDRSGSLHQLTVTDLDCREKGVEGDGDWTMIE
eukprot:TRINITY_DN25151_c0_g1_i1.p1 TRINITY_DN25151_c0_g1~~TRINITY_DN25151_c0_g1_i1.p1  ORF type:complete len:1282 (+),score=279.61 TRINITY_DN25151_c0_g1_i1:471-4316(+)